MGKRFNEEDNYFQELKVLLDTMSDVSNPREHWSGGSVQGVCKRSFVKCFFTGGLSMYSLKLTLDPKLYKGKEPFGYASSQSFISSISLKDTPYEGHYSIGFGKVGEERMDAYKAMSHFKLFPEVEVCRDNKLPYFYVESESMVLFFSSVEIERALCIMQSHGATKIGFSRFSREISYKPKDVWYYDNNKPVFINIGVLEFLRPFKL